MIPTDRKPKRLKKETSDQVRDQKILAYFDERMLNLVAQFRGLAIAAKVTPKQFFEAFVNDEAQNEFFKELHAVENEYNKKQSDELQATQIKLETDDLGESEGVSIAPPTGETQNGTTNPSIPSSEQIENL